VAAISRTFSSTALEEAGHAGRPVALVVSRQACPRCEALKTAALADPTVGSILDGRFFVIALDRDERPDLVQSLADALLLLPDARPPADPGLPSLIITTPDLRVLDGTGLMRDGRALGPALPGFLVRLADAWDAERSALELRAGVAMAALREAQGAATPPTSLRPSMLERPLAGLREAFDRRHGAFGVPPRRVPHGPLRLLLQEHVRTGDRALLAMATATLDAIVGSPLRDPRGGFFREAAGDDWSRPIEERTLSDNALLLRALVLAQEATGRSSYAEAAGGIAGFLATTLARPDGGFRHAVADGPEGEVRDDRVFAHANGLAVSALARSGRALGREEDTRLATSTAARVLERLGPARSLARWEEGGERRGRALLEDHAFLAEGLLDLHDATGDSRWRDEARVLLDAAVSRYGDTASGGFHESAGDAEVFSVRRRDAYDGRLPSANAIMVSALRRLARSTGETLYQELARRTALAFAGDLNRTPRGLETLAASVGELVGVASAPAGAPEAASARVERPRVALEAAVEPPRVRPGSKAKVGVRVRVAAGAHIIAHRPFAAGTSSREAPDLVALALAVPGSSYRLDPPQYPEGAPVSVGGSSTKVLAHAGDFTISASLMVPAGEAPADKRLRLRIVYQVCDARRCESPASALLEVPFTIVP
jgi:uncharacterized protein